MVSKRVSALCFFFVFVVLEASIAVQGRKLVLKTKPNPNDAAVFARWLVSDNTWGVLRNVVSFSDGKPGKGQGIPYFYLTTLDPTASNALKDSRASFRHSVGTCGKADPVNPTCAKLTLNGKLTVVDGNSKEAKFAEAALFSKHSEMKDWPKSHNFQFFKLGIENFFLINMFGGPKPITFDQYLHAKVDQLNFRL